VITLLLLAGNQLASTEARLTRPYEAEAHPTDVSYPAETYTKAGVSGFVCQKEKNGKLGGIPASG
jgi:hypothetical protein